MSKKTKDQEQKYRITFMGLLDLYLPYPTSDRVYSAIELYCRRNSRGIAINEKNRLDFVKMVKMEEAK